MTEKKEPLSWGRAGKGDQAHSPKKLAEIENILEGKALEPVIGKVKVKTDYEEREEQALKRALLPDRT